MEGGADVDASVETFIVVDAGPWTAHERSASVTSKGVRIPCDTSLDVIVTESQIATVPESRCSGQEVVK